MTTIVVPLDGSEVSERAIPHARYFASRLNADADVVLVSVVETPTEFTAWAGAPVMPNAPEIQYWIDDRKTYLERISNVHFDGDTRMHVSIGPPTLTIADLVDGVDDALIIMASHGRTGFRRFVLGSVAARLIRIAPCPVLVVPAHDEEVVGPGMDRVLVPLDGSQYALRALNVALELLGFGETHVHLVQVIDVPTITTPALDAAQTVRVDYDVVVQYTEAARQEAEIYLDGIREELISSGVSRADWEVREGNAADEIRVAAQLADAQLIVMATHGRSGLDRAVIGSVAEKLLSEIHRPILLVGPEGH